MPRLHPLLPMVALLATACGRLTAEPGADFGVRLVGPSSITVVGKLSTPVRFSVSGCEAFDAAIRNGASTQAVAAARLDDGSWLADVPVEWLRGQDYACLHDALSPLASRAELVVTCRDAGRSASAELEVAYGTATRAYDTAPPLVLAAARYVFPSADPLRPYALVPSFVEPIALLHPRGLVGLENAGVRLEAPMFGEPRLEAFDGGGAYSVGCPDLDWCGEVNAFAVDATTLVPSEWVEWVLDQSGGTAYVPRYVVDLALAADGTVLALSQTSRIFDPSPATVLTAIRWPPDAVQPRATVVGWFPGEVTQSRFARTADGRLAWLAWILPESGPIRSVLRTTDGHAVDARLDPTGAEDIGHVDATGVTWVSAELSPDAREIRVRNDRLIGPDGELSLLPTWHAYPTDGEGGGGGTVWLDGAIALWRGSSWITGSAYEPEDRLEVFEDAPGHPRRFEYLVGPMPGGGVTPRLYGAVSMGDKLVLTTDTGVRVLGPDGTLVGGADPLPCGLSTTSRAARVGPTTFAVGAGRYLYVFDVAAP